MNLDRLRKDIKTSLKMLNSEVTLTVCNRCGYYQSHSLRWCNCGGEFIKQTNTWKKFIYKNIQIFTIYEWRLKKIICKFDYSYKTEEEQDEWNYFWYEIVERIKNHMWKHKKELEIK
jgi:hypothetical protein